MDLEQRLRGTRAGHVVEELFTNSLHFPVANIFLELLLEGPAEYLSAPDLYTILTAGIAQAVLMGTWRYNGRPRPILGNLIGPAVYTVIEALLEGPEFFGTPNHLAYWSFALAIGVLQSVQLWAPVALERVLLVVEHVTRTCILLVMYAFVEGMTEPQFATVSGFINDTSHQFVTIVIPLLGLIVGFANLNAREHLRTLESTARLLRRYSSWLLGPELLRRAVSDPTALSMQRRERCVLFMDIRGFTSWSEAHAADEVVQMLNGYFAAAEQVLDRYEVVKSQFIGDEVMCVISETAAAVQAARDLRASEGRFLAEHSLSAGIGIHRGVAIEGLIGAEEVKSFTVIGDTVNTAKRVCDQAAGGEVLLTDPVRDELPPGTALGATRDLQLKGKREPLTVYPVR